MKITRTLISFTLLFVLVSLLAAIIIKSPADSKLNPAEVNDIVQRIENDWPYIEGKSYEEYDLPFYVMDAEGKLLLQAGGAAEREYTDNIRNRDTLIPILQKGRAEGTIVFVNDSEKLAEMHYDKVLLLLTAVLGVLYLLFLSYYLHLYVNIVLPFKKMKGFAANIARGNLDIPLEMDRNNLFGAYTESLDIMREELYAAREKERLAVESKRELIAQLSHDIKTPVATIKANSELLELKVKDEGHKVQIGRIIKKADQINVLVSDLFHSTLEELNELNVMTEETESSQIKELILSSDYRHLVELKEIRLCIVNCDIFRLQQVFDNVISNSYKYADTHIIVDSVIQDDFLEISVKDFGSGVNPEEIAALCNKFYRGKGVKGTNGAGLGLYISNDLITKMGGYLLCQNTEDGFCVVISLPLAGR